MEQVSSIKALIDALPSAIFFVDSDYRIVDLNPLARELFETPPEQIIKTLCGDFFCCYHALTAEGGCGTTTSCDHCVIRNSVIGSSQGQTFYKEKYTLQTLCNGQKSEIELLVTSFPFIYEGQEIITLVIDDITELVTLKKMLPICSHCKSIRNDENYWQEIADYIRANSNFEFTHGLCPKCVKVLYPDMKI